MSARACSSVTPGLSLPTTSRVVFEQLCVSGMGAQNSDWFGNPNLAGITPTTV